MNQTKNNINNSTPEEFYRTIMETLPVGIILTDSTGIPIYMNEQIYLMTGYTLEELAAGRWKSHADATDIEAVYRQAIIEGASGVNEEIRLVHKDGSVLWTSISWRQVMDDDGKRVGVCGTIADITKRKAAEDALDEATERYKVFAENASDLFWEMDIDGTFTYVSQSVRHLGYEIDEWVGHNVCEFMPPTEQEIYKLRAPEDLLNPHSILDEVRVFRKDGSIIWLELMIDFVLKDGKPYKVHGAARDITLRKHTEEALRESEQKYKSIVEHSNDIIMLTRPDGTIAYMSPASHKIIGYEPEEFIGKVSWVIFPDDVETVKQVHSRAIMGESGSNIEYRILTKSNEMKWVSRAWSPIMNNGQVQMVVNVVRDITEHKQSEESLRLAHTELEQAYNIQREFLNNVTHEVRTPLTAVKGYVEMLMEGIAGPVSEEQTALLKKVLTSSDHLLEVVNGILQIARLKSGKIAVNPRVCEPKSIMDKSVSVVLPQAQQKGLSINMYSNQAGCMGTYDEEKLLMILTNLLTNAVKFTESGKIEVFIECTTAGVEFIIADTGMGINNSDLSIIFDEFQQLDHPRKHKPSGFGIGLAIVATMVETIGASLTVSSKKDVGTAFLLKVPALEA